MIRKYYDTIGGGLGAGGNGEIPTVVKMRHLQEADKRVIEYYGDTHEPYRLAFKIGYENGAAAEYRRHLSPSPGLKWVKASERLPEKCNDVIIRVIGKPVEVTVGCVADSEEEWAVDGCSWFYYDTEWLDESPSLPGEQVEGKALENISRIIHPATESTDRTLSFAPPSVEADQQDARKRGLKAFDDSMKNTLGEIIEPEESPFAHNEEIECLKAEVEAYKKTAALMGEEVNTLRSSGQIAQSEYKRDMEIVKGERDHYREALAEESSYLPKCVAKTRIENALNKFTNNTKDA